MRKLSMIGIACAILILSAGISQATEIFSEDFESGIPTTWTIIDDDWAESGPDGQTWNDQNPGNQSPDYVIGSFMICDADHSGYSYIYRDELISPIIDCSAAADLELRFGNNYVAGWSGTADVDIRINGGEWQNLISYTTSSDDGTERIDISSIADRQSSVEFRWYYYGAQGDGYWAVDNIILNATVLPDDDIAAVGLAEPAGVLHLDREYYPSALVFNNGLIAQTFDVNLVINNSYMEELYNQTVTGVTLNPSETSEAPFTTAFTAAVDDDYTFTITVSNTGDEDNSNDIYTATIHAYTHYGVSNPDPYGYIFKDNTVDGGPVYDYYDISSSGDSLGTGRRLAFGPYSFGFDFPFYQSSFSEFYVSTTGLITFNGAENSRYNYCPVPGSDSPDYWISPFWDYLDMSYEDDGAVIRGQYFDDDIDFYVIEWVNFMIRSEEGDPMDMEVILYEDGNIVFQYKHINDLPNGRGQEATIGIEQDVNSGLSYFCNDDYPGNRLYSGLAIGWYPPQIQHEIGVTSIDQPTFSLAVTDASIEVVATLINNASASETFDTYLKIKNALDEIVFADTVNLTLAEGATDQVTFDSWNATAADVYSIEVSVSIPDDANPENDILSTSVKIVAPVSLPVSQDFEGEFPPTGWTYFDFGGADPWGTNTNHYRSPSHSAQAVYDWFDEADDWLVMAPVDLSEANGVLWSYYEEASQWPNNGLRHSFYVSTGEYFDPETATQIAVHTPADHEITNFNGNPVEFDITDYIGNSHVWLAYHFENAGNTEYWWIDDVSITIIPDADVGVKAISAPYPAIVTNCNSPVEILVKNFGLLPQTFDVNVTITGNVLGEVYNSTMNVTGLSADQETTVSFPVFALPQEDDYTINAVTLLSGDENISNDTKTQGMYVSTTINHSWDDGSAEQNITVYPFDNSMIAVRYTPYATDFTILGGELYIDNYNPDDNDYAEYEWVKICPDQSGQPDIDNAFGTVSNVGTYTVPALLQVDIADVPLTDYEGDIWIVVKFWNGRDSWLQLGADTDNPDGNSYTTISSTPPNWTQQTIRDCMMRIRVEYQPCSPPGYAYLPGDANMAAGIWPPVVVGGDVTYLVNYFRGLVPHCKLGGFYAAADVNGTCSVNGSDVTKLVNYFRGMGDKEYCPDYEPLWLSPADVPTEAPAGWPNCDD